MKKFIVYVECGEDVTKFAIPAKNKKTAEDVGSRLGNVVCVKDVTETLVIKAEDVKNALRNAEFSEIEISMITKALIVTDIAE